MDFILQKKDGACQLITLMNACIHKNGKSSMRYKSKRFLKLLDECGGSHGAIININPALKELNVSFGTNRCRTKKGLKEWIIRKLKKGFIIDFTMMHPRWNLHSVLIVGYDHFWNITKTRKYEAFTVINSQLLTQATSLEFLTWELLTMETDSIQLLDAKTIIFGEYID